MNQYTDVSNTSLSYDSKTEFNSNIGGNFAVSEALGAGSGAATSLIVADALTNSGNFSGNFKTRALSAAASLVVGDAVTEFIKPAEEKVMGKL